MYLQILKKDLKRKRTMNVILLTVRVYDVASGELIATEVIENSDSTYFNRIPRIYLLDGAKTAVVLLGGSISEVDTLVSTFTFGE